jgi:hypothetical protein
MYTNNVAWETLRSVDSSTFAGSYVALGSSLSHPAYRLKLVNNSNVLVTVSIDGSTDIDVAPAGSFWLYDESFAGPSGAFPALPSGTQIFVKGSVGVGSVYLVVQYIVVK